MMIRRIDENGDFVFGHGSADYLTGDPAIALLIEQRLQLWLGEWFLDVTAGVNWWMILGSRPPALILAEQEIRECVAATEGVAQVNSLTVTFSHQTFIAGVSGSVTTVNSNVLLFNIQQSVQVGVE